MVRRKLPTVFEHRGSKQYAVKIGGRFHYLGAVSTTTLAEAQQRAALLIAHGPEALQRATAEPGILLSELLAKYLDFAESRYAGTVELDHIQRLCRRLAERLPGLEAARFGPSALAAWRDEMALRHDWTASYAKGAVGRVIRLFKWATASELVPGSVFQALSCVGALPLPREVRPATKREPVSVEDLERTLPHLPELHRAAVRLLALTGLRPNELLRIRMEDLDTGQDPWVYTLKAHKTAKAVGVRRVFLGPEAQRILKDYLRLDPKAPLLVGRQGTQLTALALGLVVKRACRAAGVNHWVLYQLRHLAACRLRDELGEETSKAVLGHTQIRMTENYLTRDEIRAREAARRLG